MEGFYQECGGILFSNMKGHVACRVQSSVEEYQKKYRKVLNILYILNIVYVTAKVPPHYCKISLYITEYPLH